MRVLKLNLEVRMAGYSGNQEEVLLQLFKWLL